MILWIHSRNLVNIKILLLFLYYINQKTGFNKYTLEYLKQRKNLETSSNTLDATVFAWLGSIFNIIDIIYISISLFP